MFTKKRRFGNLGEDISCTHLKQNGYKILERNFQLKFGELDIVAEKNNELVFVEVKTSSYNSLIKAEENLTPNKLNKLLRTISIYLSSVKKDLSSKYRIDLIAVTIDREAKKAFIKHFKNINIS